MIKFERVSKYPDAVIPTRSTANSAGYDFTVPADIVIPSYSNQMSEMVQWGRTGHIYTLTEMANFTKFHHSSLHFKCVIRNT